MYSSSILIVEDNNDNYEILSTLMNANGFNTQHASSGEEALLILETQTPDLIIMDIAMPVMDGWETIRKIRSSTRLKDVPIVVATALVDRENTELAQKARARYVELPIDPKSFMEVVKEAMESLCV